MTKPRQPDRLLMAHIAVNLVPGLSGSARRVAGAILAHWNRRTGQCDPSVERLSRMLDLDRATVLRATAELSKGPNRLFAKQSHGGKAGRAAYQPAWERFFAIVEDWNHRMLTGTAPAAGKVAELRPATSQNCDLGGRRTATQTSCSNLLNEPSRVRARVEPAPQQPDIPVTNRAGKKRRTGTVPGQGWLLLPLPGREQDRAPDRAVIRETAAERRLMNDVRAMGAEIYRSVCVAADPDMMAPAITAEMQVPGSGAGVLIAAVEAAARRTA